LQQSTKAEHEGGRKGLQNEGTKDDEWESKNLDDELRSGRPEAVIGARKRNTEETTKYHEEPRKTANEGE